MPELKVKIHKLEGFTSAYEEYYREVSDKRIEITNSEKFKNRVLNNTYISRNWFGGKNTVVGMYGLNESLESFYNTIMRAREKGRIEGAEDGVQDIMVRLVKMPRGVLGSMNPGNPWYNLSKDFFLDCMIHRWDHLLAMNQTHEFIHFLGFIHKTRIVSLRANDPAYTAGYIMKDLYPPNQSLMSSLEDIPRWYLDGCLKCGTV